MTALREKMLWVCLLKVVASDFTTGNLCRDGQNRYTTSMAIVESVDQMEIAGPQLPAQTANFPVR